MAKKGLAKSIVILIILVAGFTGIFIYKKIAARNSLAARIAALSPNGAPPQSIEELRQAIDLYEKKIDEHIADAAKTGIYWKILGSRLMDGTKPLYGEALGALEEAARYYPDDESIHYLIGIAAGNLAKAEYFFPGEQAEHYRIAESAYKRAVDLNGRYGKALYGLGVLYVYDLERPLEAIPYLERYLDITTRSTDGMFVLAAARYMTENYEEAALLYDRIIGITKDKNIKMQAEQLKQQVMDEWYR